MFKYVNNDITVAIMLDNRQTTTSDNRPVKVWVTYRRDSTGKNVSLEEWEKLSEGMVDLPDSNQCVYARSIISRMMMYGR